MRQRQSGSWRGAEARLFDIVKHDNRGAIPRPWLNMSNRANLMTIKETLAAIKAAGMVGRWSPELSEFRVAFKASDLPSATRREDAAYYTGSRQDAVDTARAMRAWFDRLSTKETAIFTR